MSTKFIGMEGQESSVAQTDLLHSPSSDLLFTAHQKIIQVREPQKIPRKIREFFKIDLKSNLPLPTDKKIFLSQVLMHELDEGARILNRMGRYEVAESILSSSPKMHLSNQLRLLRNTLEEKTFSEAPPENIQEGNKIRNNQVGFLNGKFKNGKYHAMSMEGILYKGRNEDAVLVDPEREFLAVLDGMGGHQGGNIASCIMTDFLEYGLSHGMSMEQAICMGNEAVLERSKNDAKLGGAYPMGTTLVMAQITGDKLKSIHVGDSKLVVIREGKIVFETQDHTNGQSLFRESLIDADTAHFLNHILSRNLGTDPILPNRDLEKNAFTLKIGDRVLLMSDGISDNFYSREFKLDELASLASKGDLEEASRHIREICLERMKEGKLSSGYRSKPDNITLLIYQHR